MSKPLTLEITRGACTVKVHGKRSTKGWNVDLVDGARCDRQGHRKAKEDAIQLALDCCEPGLVAVFRVQPSE
jgi:hypothetical protein